MTTTTPAGLTAEPIAPDRVGRACFAIPLSGTDGAGRSALVDADGLTALREAGARALYLTGNGQGRAYVTFVQFPSKRAMTAARAIMGDPKARRIEYANGNRLDLRGQNLHARDYAGVGDSRPAQ